MDRGRFVVLAAEPAGETLIEATHYWIFVIFVVPQSASLNAINSPG
jgi:hypothetical protein